MPITYHQFSNQNELYFPSWEIKHLFLGTFNPEGGEIVNYYYGRPKNQAWPLLSEIFKMELNPNRADFFRLLKEKKIACMDLIHSVEYEQEKMNQIIGKGYNDSKIINNRVRRVYNTKKIIDLINQNPNVNIYSTWGKGSNNADWKNEVNQLGNLTHLVSPSFAARVPKGKVKYQYMLDDWSNKITL